MTSLARPRRSERGAADATREPDPGPRPELIFERATGPYVRRPAGAPAAPGPRAGDEET